MSILNRDEKLILRIATDAYKHSAAGARDTNDAFASEAIKLQGMIGARHVLEALRAMGSQAPSADADPLLHQLERIGLMLTMAAIVAPRVAEVTRDTLGKAHSGHMDGSAPIVVEDGPQ